MRKIILGVALGALLGGAITATAARQEIGQGFGKGETATMTGGATEVPAGDPDGSGSALVRLDTANGLVCFHVTVKDVDFPLLAAHIHKAPAGVAGPVVIPIVPPAQSGSSATGESKGCVSADPALIQDVLANPAQYYVNVHNSKYPGGAVRGQLSTLAEAPVKPRVITKTKIVRVHDCKKVAKKKA